MKSVIKNSENTIPIPYPRIAKYDFDNKTVHVLFIRPETGVVINTESPKYPLGFYHERWGEDKFRVVPEGTEITLIQ